MRIVAIIVVIIVLVLLLVGLGGCSSYSRIVQLDEAAKAQWANIDTQLQRRYELIPNVVETVKGYAAHEKGVFDDIARARQSYFSAPDQESKVRASGDVERALSRLLSLSENYPNLKANEGFLKLQDQLEGTENRISTERTHYNQSVQELDAYLRSPSGMLGNLFAHVQPRQPFGADAAARSAPHVDFGTSAAAPTPTAGEAQPQPVTTPRSAP